MTQALHLPPAEIERRLLDNVAMYEHSRWPNATTRMLANHWRDCLHKFHAYQEGKIERQGLPLDVLQMGWAMPEWGTRGT